MPLIYDLSWIYVCSRLSNELIDHYRCLLLIHDLFMIFFLQFQVRIPCRADKVVGASQQIKQLPVVTIFSTITYRDFPLILMTSLSWFFSLFLMKFSMALNCIYNYFSHSFILKFLIVSVIVFLSSLQPVLPANHILPSVHEVDQFRWVSCSSLLSLFPFRDMTLIHSSHSVL